MPLPSARVHKGPLCHGSPSCLSWLYRSCAAALYTWLFISFFAAAHGTWNYMAPEIILGQKCTAAADIWSLGVLLWELATGEVPIRGRMREVA